MKRRPYRPLCVMPVRNVSLPCPYCRATFLDEISLWNHAPRCSREGKI